MNKIFSTKALVIYFLCTMGLNIVLNFTDLGIPGVVARGQAETIPDMQPGNSPEQIAEVLHKMGAEGRRLYTDVLLPIDMFFPLAYGLLLAALIYRYTKESKLSYLAILPIIGTLFDYVENINMLNILHNYKTLEVPAYLPLITMLKFGFIGLSFIIVVFFGAPKIVKIIKQNSK